MTVVIPRADLDAARALHASAGFTECAPFGAYRPDRHSTFLAVVL